MSRPLIFRCNTYLKILILAAVSKTIGKTFYCARSSKLDTNPGTTEGVYLIQTYLDEKGLGSFLSHLSLPEQDSLGFYIRNVMLFFGAGSIIAAIVLPLRLVVSIWLGRNRGTV